MLSLEEWAKANSIKMLVVSYDSDWKKFCEGSEVMDYTEDLGTALSLFQPHNFASAALDQLAGAFLGIEESKVIEVLESHFSDAVELLDIFPDASSAYFYEYDIEEVKFISFSPLLDKTGKPMVRVVDVEEKEVALYCRITMTIGVSCSFEFSVEDFIDKDYVPIGYSTEYREVDFATGVLINAVFEDESDLSTFEISHVELTELISSVDFGEVEPHLEDEDR